MPNNGSATALSGADVDFRRNARHGASHDVTLTKEAEGYVCEVMNQLSAGKADEIVSFLILKQRADDAFDLRHPARTEDQLVGELLQGVRAPHRPWQPGEFRRQAERLVAERKAL